MSATTAFLRTPTSPPPSVVFQVGKFLLINGVPEPAAQPRLYEVRPSRDEDHPMIRSDREEALRKGFKRWATCITITRLADRKQWIFAEFSVGFPRGFEDTDAHAIARLTANGRRSLGDT